MAILRGAALTIGVGLALACGPPPPRSVELATTTSVQNSGLLDSVRPAAEAATGLLIRVHAAGSGRALQMLANGAVDAVISHAPDTEQRLLVEHPGWSYRKIAYNAFVVVGPRSDPARLRESRDIVDAFQRIADSGSTFVSRGDESGTHEREDTFWKAAGRRPAGGRLIVSGRGMAQALRHADEAQAYTLTDAPTFWQVGDGLDLQILFDDDPRLMNTYALVHRRDRPEALALAEWIHSAAGRAAMAAFTIDGRRGFEPWPEGCAAAAPAALPCAPSKSAP
ncbi:MAG: hypothetical protein A3J29_20675 [Acidobacteria bacterium RIFCSPLOWO2_12_FULL_67_14b]|nr:MAG: hypothetical protein A3J29_20675 [Acidobacteria bacterium RIFCSPLOWO2_12_FULL_67_14b]